MDRLDFYATPRSGTFDRRFFFRKSPRISQVIDEARERPAIDPKIQPRVGRLIARNRFAGLSLVESQSNEGMNALYPRIVSAPMENW